MQTLDDLPFRVAVGVAGVPAGSKIIDVSSSSIDMSREQVEAMAVMLRAKKGAAGQALGSLHERPQMTAGPSRGSRRRLTPEWRKTLDLFSCLAADGPETWHYY